MYLREPLYPFATRASRPVQAAAVICSISVIVLFFVPMPISMANFRSNIPGSPPRATIKTNAPGQVNGVALNVPASKSPLTPR
jgi:hypothetical protein